MISERDQNLIDLYKKMQSVWRVGEAVGLSGQHVHEILKKHDLVKPAKLVDDLILDRIRSEYQLHRDNGRMRAFAKELGISHITLCKRAKTLGLTDRNHSKTYRTHWNDVPTSTLVLLLNKYVKSRQSLKVFCMNNKIGNVFFSRTMHDRLPAEWAEAMERKSTQKKYNKGRSFEYKIKKIFEAKGYFVIRSPMSRGVADLVAIKPNIRPLFIQCKFSKQGWKPGEWNRLFEESRNYDATPIFAYVDEDGESQIEEILSVKDNSRRVMPTKKYDWNEQ